MTPGRTERTRVQALTSQADALSNLDAALRAVGLRADALGILEIYRAALRDFEVETVDAADLALEEGGKDRAWDLRVTSKMTLDRIDLLSLELEEEVR